MNKNLHYESNASLLNIPAENLACKNISEILTAPLTIKGVGVKKADKLYVIKEVIRRIMEESPNDNPVIHGPEDVSNFFMPKLLHETKEHFMIALLNTKNRIIAAPTISIGSLSASGGSSQGNIQRGHKIPLRRYYPCPQSPQRRPQTQQGRYCGYRKAGQGRQNHGYSHYRPCNHRSAKIPEHEGKRPHKITKQGRQSCLPYCCATALQEPLQKHYNHLDITFSIKLARPMSLLGPDDFF